LGLGTSSVFITSRKESGAFGSDGSILRGSADWTRICSEWNRKHSSGLCERLSIDEPISSTTWGRLSDRREEGKEERKEEVLSAEALDRIAEAECLSDEEEDEEDSDASEDQSEGEADEVLEELLPEAEAERSVAIGKAALPRILKSSKYIDDEAVRR